MHQCLKRSCDVTVVDEEVFFDIKCRVAAFEIAGAIVSDAMPEDQILCACRGANRIGLHEAYLLKRTVECCRPEEVPRDGESSQVVDSDRHARKDSRIDRETLRV